MAERNRSLSRVLKKVELASTPYPIKVPAKPQATPQSVPTEEKQDLAFLQEQEELLEKAEAEAQKLIAQAQAQSQILEEEAREKGYSQGFAQGQKEGRTQGREEGLHSAQPIIARIEEVLAQAIGASPQIQQQLEQQLVKLALAIAEKVVGELAREKEELVLQTAKHALTRVRGESQVTIRVNWQDLDLVQAEREVLLAHTDGIGEIIIREDPRVGRGGCLIETNLGAIDARLETQLEELGKLAEEGKDTGRTGSRQLPGESGTN